MPSFRSIPPFSLLLVEDDKTTREIVKRMVALKFPQCTIYTAEHGKKGLELFMEHTPDLVVTDINMPEMDGIEMARAIKAVNPNATYIVLSARDDKDYICVFRPMSATHSDSCRPPIPIESGHLFRSKSAAHSV